MDKAREKLTPGVAQAGRADVQGGTSAAWAPGAGATPDASPGGDHGGDGQAKKKDEGVIDAEYVDVEDKK